jgi:hypothetical protein
MSESKELQSGFMSAPDTKRESAQEEYYRVQLLKLKFDEDLSKNLSEKDQLKKTILKRIRLVHESSPEWYELVSTTGTENQYEQAEYLASAAIKKRKAERAMEKYTGGAGAADVIFDNSAVAANSFRASSGAGGLGVFAGLAGGEAAPIVEALKRAGLIPTAAP